VNPARIARGNAKPCTRCHERYQQDRRGLCRRCARELGDRSTLFEQERDHVARMHARDRSGRVPAGELVPRPDKWITLDGVDYLIVWDGA
jgi:hypothetical protein